MESIIGIIGICLFIIWISTLTLTPKKMGGTLIEASELTNLGSTETFGASDWNNSHYGVQLWNGWPY